VTKEAEAEARELVVLKEALVLLRKVVKSPIWSIGICSKKL
jgi:hypothetical protein